jgi:hypothetical protein
MVEIAPEEETTARFPTVNGVVEARPPPPAEPNVYVKNGEVEATIIAFPTFDEVAEPYPVPP